MQAKPIHLALVFAPFLFAAVCTQAQPASPQQTLQQYVADLQSNPNDTALREKIIALAQTMNPPPAISAEAKRHMSRGIAAVEDAKTPDDFGGACGEFQQASTLAPWWGDTYRNLAVAQNKAGRYDDSLASLRLYLLTKPSAADVDWAQDLQSKVEYRKEKVESEQKLAYSLTYGHLDERQARVLIEQGADVNARSQSGSPVLVLAASNGLTDIVSLMIDKGANIEATTEDGVNALMMAASEGYVDTVQVLLNRGANVNATANDGYTALMSASCRSVFAGGASANSPAIIRMLIAKGADVNARDHKGETAFKKSQSICGSPEAAQALREAGAR